MPFQPRHLDFCSGEIAKSRDQSDLPPAEFVRGATLDIQGAYQPSPPYQGHGQESLNLALRQFVEKLEPRIQPCPSRNDGEFSWGGSPSRHALYNCELETTDEAWRRVLGGMEHQFTALKNIKAARIAGHELTHNPNDVP
jgi:hypothetical protein